MIKILAPQTVDAVEVGAELWQFFMAGKQIDGDFPFVAS